MSVILVIVAFLAGYHIGRGTFRRTFSAMKEDLNNRDEYWDNQYHKQIEYREIGNKW